MPNSYGTWIGLYRGLEDLVQTIQHNATLVAIKTNGSDWVPAGTMTWIVNLRTMECRGVVGNIKTGDLTTVPAKLTVIDRDRIKVEWDFSGLDEPDTENTVTYTRQGI